MTELERLKLRRYRDHYGALGMMPKTADEALAMAIEDETMGKSLDPFDPARLHFTRGQKDMENIALLLEKEAAAARAKP